MTKKRVLIVEDQGITALDEVQMMRDLGYEVTGLAMNGKDAIRMAGEDRPDVILMDINLPGGMDGNRAAKKIRDLHQIPVVFVTAFGNKAQSKAEDLSLPEGIGYVVKPFSREELESEIERVTRQS